MDLVSPSANRRNPLPLLVVLTQGEVADEFCNKDSNSIVCLQCLVMIGEREAKLMLGL